jgi:hypothetical protein
MPGLQFETKIRKIIGDHLKNSSIRGVSKRNVMTRWSSQEIDIVVDSPEPAWYMGIECKSTTIKKTPATFYFSNTFHKDQFKNLIDFFWNSGRRGFVAVEIGFNRNRTNGEVSHPHKRGTYIIDWADLVGVYEAGDKSFKLLCEDEIPNRVLKKVDSTKYNVEEAFDV